MPWCMSSAWLFVEGLIMVNPHPFNLQQISCNFSKALAENNLLCSGGISPDVHDLQKCFAIGIPVFHGKVLGIQPVDFSCNDFIHGL